MSLENWVFCDDGGSPLFLHNSQPIAIGTTPVRRDNTDFFQVEVAVLPTRDLSAEPFKTRVIDERGAFDEERAVQNTRQFLSYGGPRELDEPRVQHLVEAGLSRSEAVDYWMTAERGLSQEEWADKCGCSQQAISDSVLRAREKLNI